MTLAYSSGPTGWSRRLAIVVALAIGALAGCSTTAEHTEGDPLESFNRGVYGFNKTVDRAVLRPIAVGYDTVVPTPINMAVTNFFGNLEDVRNAANNLLQFKLTAAFEDVGRVAFNSTLGIGGLIDIASAVGMEKHDEDFGQTLGVWGVGAGPYLVLPLLGPSSLRDAPARAVDATVLSPPFYLDSGSARFALSATDAVDTRAGLLPAEKVLEEAAPADEYSFVRDAHVQRRESKVYDGDPPVELLEE